MPNTEKRTAELLERANSLPTCPGVYIMRDRNAKIIYVGKSRKLKNRVSQYFQQSKKNAKTSRMVYAAEDFEYIVCKTEIEALSLENSLIKQHSPKYNIKLKDAKSYPYIKITDAEYPKILFTRSRTSDRCKYYGPFSGSSVAYSILDILHKSLGIPSCKRRFPEDFAKERPCIYYQMKQCCGLCTGEVSREEYAKLISCAADILKGNIGEARKALSEQMMQMAEDENFEGAARCRDTIRALERLNQKQHVVASPDTNIDVFAFYSDEFVNCISVLYVRDGVVNDKADFVLNSDAITDTEALLSFVADHYIRNDTIPKTVFISFEAQKPDLETLEQFLSDRAGHRVYIRHPERGAGKELTEIVYNNALEKARQVKLETQKDEGVLCDLASLLQLESLPERIEAYDISNIGKENITAGMVVYENGRPAKTEYRLFKIRSLVDTTDDYASMQEALRRRIKHLREDEEGSFAKYPDLLLIDGGKGHVSAVKQVLAEQELSIPVYGMVKDDFHKTRALCTDTAEINIAKEKAIFMLIYKIQEEVHRFTVEKVMAAKRSTLKRSSLENISGIGPNKAKKLLAAFGTLSAMKNASESEISAIKGISASDARNVYEYFRRKDKK